jgi:hypothetical protein
MRSAGSRSCARGNRQRLGGFESREMDLARRPRVFSSSPPEDCPRLGSISHPPRGFAQAARGWVLPSLNCVWLLFDWTPSHAASESAKASQKRSRGSDREGCGSYLRTQTDQSSLLGLEEPLRAKSTRPVKAEKKIQSEPRVFHRVIANAPMQGRIKVGGPQNPGTERYYRASPDRNRGLGIGIWFPIHHQRTHYLDPSDFKSRRDAEAGRRLWWPQICAYN